MGEVAAIRATIRGIVQGVGFRYATQRTALRLGVVGWVRNQTDGGVEVLAQGDADAIDQLCEFLATGPSLAEVASLDVSPAVADPALTSFDVVG